MSKRYTSADEKVPESNALQIWTCAYCGFKTNDLVVIRNHHCQLKRLLKQIEDD